MLEPWDGVEAPVTMFARADKYERQLERHSIPKQPELRLSYAASTYQISGQFNAAMQEWHAKMLANKTFPNFRVYIQNEYTKQVKRNRSTAGSVGKGIANKATEVPEQKFSDAKAQAMVIAEVANVLQAQNKQQMKNMMSMFKKLLTFFAIICHASCRCPTPNPHQTPTPHGMSPLQQEASQSREVLGTRCQQGFQAGKLEVRQEHLMVCGG